MLAEPWYFTDSAPVRVEQRLSEDDLVRFCSEFLSQTPMCERFVNEARFGLARLLPVLSSLKGNNLDILEVGAGHCILSAYLASRNLRVTAVEPLGPEVDFFANLQHRVVDFCRQNAIILNLVRTTGEQLDFRAQFDIAFTINALEHMHDPLATIDNMYGSLKPGGILLAHCPNYTIPFEVHFNVLLVTRSKPLNKLLYRSKIDRDPQIWDGLNFIRYIDVRRRLVRRGFRFRFNHSVMRDLVMRTLSDPIFADRMPSVVRGVGKFLQSIGLLKVLALIPARLQTPMEVLIRKS
jgi:SAM-dependent methyltransferase